MERIQQLVSVAPNHFAKVNPDWVGVAEVLQTVGLSSADVVAATWCALGHANIEAGIDESQLVLIHPRGVVATVGKKKMFGGARKFDGFEFAQVRTITPADYRDERGYGKFCIEFDAAGGMMLGRLQWDWTGRRFRNTQDEIIAVAEERDRVLSLVSRLAS